VSANGATAIRPGEQALLKSVAKKVPKAIAPKPVIDWRNGQRTRAAVRIAIRDALGDLPEKVFSDDAFEKTVEEVFEHVYESNRGDGKSRYREEAN